MCVSYTYILPVLLTRWPILPKGCPTRPGLPGVDGLVCHVSYVCVSCRIISCPKGYHIFTPRGAPQGN